MSPLGASNEVETSTLKLIEAIGFLEEASNFEKLTVSEVRQLRCNRVHLYNIAKRIDNVLATIVKGE